MAIGGSTLRDAHERFRVSVRDTNSTASLKPRVDVMCMGCWCGLSAEGGDQHRMFLDVLASRCQCEKTDNDRGLLAARGVERMLRWLAPDAERIAWRRSMDEQTARAVVQNKLDQMSIAASCERLRIQEVADAIRGPTEYEIRRAKEHEEWADRKLLRRALKDLPLRDHEKQRASELVWRHYGMDRGRGGLATGLAAALYMCPPGPR